MKNGMDRIDESGTTNRVLVAVDILRDRWSARATYFEHLAGSDTDLLAQLGKEHARIIRNCIGELYTAIDEVTDS